MGKRTELEVQFDYYLHEIGIPAVGFYGIAGNIICIFVLCRSEMLKGPFSILLIGLSVSDIIYLMGETIVYLPHWLQLLGIVGALTFRDINIIKIPLHVLDSGQIASIYFTLAINWNRYIAICDPFNVKSTCSKKRLLVISGLIFIFAFVVQLPILLGGIILVVNGHLLDENSVNYFEPYQRYMATWGFPLIKFAIPLICLVVFNTRIWLEMRRSSKFRSALYGGTSDDQYHLDLRTLEERAVTRMLLVVVAVFGIFYAPLIIFSVLNSFFDVDDVFGRIPGTIAIFLIPLNSSANVLIYFLMGKQFRKCFNDMFNCRRGKTENLNQVNCQ